MSLFDGQQNSKAFRFTLLPDRFNVSLLVSMDWVSKTKLDIDSDLVNEEFDNIKMSFLDGEEDRVPHLSHLSIV